MEAFAVVEIGSNALRLAIGRSGQLHEDYIIRKALRLGSDTFNQGFISQRKQEKLIESLKAFKEEIHQLNIKNYRVVATSALREAQNKQEILTCVKDELALDIELISGQEEAKLIFRAIKDLYTPPGLEDTLVMDIGGGSVELISHLKTQENYEAESLKIGTVRLLAHTDFEDRPKSWTKKIQKSLDSCVNVNLKEFKKSQNKFFVGTGGNVRALGRLAVDFSISKQGEKLSFKKISALIDLLEEYDFEGRIEELQLKKDRADVILPAAYIIYNIMEKFDISHLHIPTVGLKNGLLLNQ